MKTLLESNNLEICEKQVNTHGLPNGDALYTRIKEHST